MLGFTLPLQKYYIRSLFRLIQNSRNMVAATKLEAKSLLAFKNGDVGEIKHFTNEQIAGKLIAMGILPGKTLQLIRKAPFGGALYVKNGNHVIALRQHEAASIIMADGKI